MYDPIIEQDINNAYFNLIFFFIIIFILIFFLYISFVYSTKPEDNLSISSADYSLYEKDSRQPDLLNAGETAKLGYNGPKDFNTDKLYKYSKINHCPTGQCAININTGSKRCPSDNVTLLAYDVEYEQCTGKFTCDFSSLPYAVQPDGSAYNSSCEGNEIPCRCVEKPQCAYQVMSIIDMANGSAFNNSDTLNYYFSINSSGKNYFSKDPISFDAEDLGIKYCKINPSFINRVERGCNLINSIYDPVDCRDSNLIQLINDNSNTYNLIPQLNSAGDSSGFTIYKGDNTINIFIPPGSELISYDNNIFNFTQNGTSYTIFSDSAVDKTSQVFYSPADIPIFYTLNYIQLNNIKSKETNSVTVNNGFPITIDNIDVTVKVEDSLNIKLIPEIYIYTPCQNNFTGGANYKNMLMCLQPGNQPCTNGVLTYNIDKIIDTDETNNIYNQENSRNFCTAFNKDRLNPGKDYYLRDPGFYTTSCMIGTGCGGEFNKNLCVITNGTLDCRQAINERKSEFFSNFDQSGVNNVWVFSADEINLTGDTLNEIKITANTLMELEPGDYWSKFNQPLVKFLNNQVSAGSSIFNLNNITDLEIGMSVQFPNYPDPLPSITSIDTTNKSINISSGVSTALQKNDTIRIITNLGENDFGIIGKNINNNYFYLLNIEGNGAADINKNIIGVKDGLVIYKQFGFNGINYNTVFTDNNNSTFRIYSDSSVFKTLPSNSGTVRPVQNIFNTINSGDINSYSQESFQNADMPFKNQKSMYYPVWNNSNFKQECIMCDPSFLSYVILSTDGEVTGIQIQFSGQSYSTYILFSDTGYVYNTFTELDANSNTNYMIMKDINTNINVGDFILDSTGFLTREFVSLNNVVNTNSEENFTLVDISANNISESQIINSKAPNTYSPFNIINKLGKTITFNPFGPAKAFNTGNGVFQSNYNNPNVNFFTGKLYNDTTGNPYGIKPINKVVDIIGNVLITDAPVNISLASGTFIQTIKAEEILELKIEQDIDGGTGTGSGATVLVNEITAGRISDVAITNKGQNYSIENRPAVLVSNYYRGNEINIIKD